MSGPVLLLRHSLRRTRTLVLTTGILLGVFQVVLVAVAGSIQGAGGFETLRSALLLRLSANSWGLRSSALCRLVGIVCVGYFHVATMAALVGLIVALAMIPVSEIESGFADLLLSRPIARHWIITRTIATIMLSILVLLVLMLTGTWAGLELLAPRGIAWPSTKADPVARDQSWRAVAVLGRGRDGDWQCIAAAQCRGRGCGTPCAGNVSAGLCGSFMAAGRESVAWLSPFRYYTPFDLVMGHALPWKNLVVPGGIAVAGFAVAYVLFARRDIAR